MSILILTGPPAAGKNAVAAELARLRERCAVVDVDSVRQMLVTPHRAPWEGDEGARQQIFGVENACWLARRFAGAGNDVVLMDVIFPFTQDVYAAELRGYSSHIVMLMPTLDEILTRNRNRGWLPDNEVRMLYDVMRAYTGHEELIDNTGIAPGVVAGRLTARLDRA